jgi:large subunit ribosomal protein L3
MRTGIVAKKMGMTRLFAEDGTSVAVTVLLADNCIVVEQKTLVKNGYDAVSIGTIPIKASRLSCAMRGFYERKGLEPCRLLREFRVTPDNLLNVGDSVRVDHFSTGQLIDVTGVSIGKGFAGAMKRHGFGGLRATHGVSLSHRSHGSTGNRTKPGRVFKNKRMAGQMGNSRVTVLNLTVHSLDVERGLLFVEGCVPGPKGGVVLVRDAIKAGTKNVVGK